MNFNEPLGLEWTTLQNNHAHYERGALAWKVATVIFGFARLGLLVPYGLR